MGEDIMKRRYVNALITVLVMSVSFSMTAMAVPEDQNVESLETQKAQVQSQADDVQKQLVGLLVQYDALQQDIEKQKERVSQAQEELKAAEAEEQDQYQAMKKRIRYINRWMNTDPSIRLKYSDYYFGLSNVQEMNCGKEKNIRRFSVADRKADLEAGQADMEQMSQDMGRQQADLQTTLDGMRSQIADFDSQLETARAEAAAQLDQLTDATENMVDAAEGQTDADQPSQGGNGGNNGNNGNNGNQNGNNGGGSNNGGSKPSGGGNKPSGGGTTSTPGNASLGQQIANTACQYVGNPYKYGGTSLTNGADCSGFVMSVHALFGISTPRDSWSQLAGGKAVNYSDMLPGDVIVYSGHVAIYIGGNQIVHASNSAPYPAGGIKISSPPNYRTILGVRRYW